MTPDLTHLFRGRNGAALGGTRLRRRLRTSVVIALLAVMGVWTPGPWEAETHMAILEPDGRLRGPLREWGVDIGLLTYLRCKAWRLGDEPWHYSFVVEPRRAILTVGLCALIWWVALGPRRSSRTGPA